MLGGLGAWDVATMRITDDCRDYDDCDLLNASRNTSLSLDILPAAIRLDDSGGDFAPWPAVRAFRRQLS